MTRSETASWLLAHDNFCILTHRNPDGDTIGCAVGLCRGLRSLGKTAHILRNPQFGPRYEPWYGGLLCESPAADDAIVSVDIASEALLPDNAQPLAGKIQLALDHHGSNTGFAACACVEPDLAACGELIYGILRELNVELTADMASALYLAVSTDTGCFQYANTTADTLRVAAALMEAGCEAYPINKEFFGTKSIARLRLESRLTESLELLGGGKVAISYIPLAWMEELNLREEELDSISGFCRSVTGVKIGITIRQQAGGKQKVSLRTADCANASAICAHLGGGGHKAAAGATVTATYEEVRTMILDALRAEGIEV